MQRRIAIYPSPSRSQKIGVFVCASSRSPEPQCGATHSPQRRSEDQAADWITLLDATTRILGKLGKIEVQ